MTWLRCAFLLSLLVSIVIHLTAVAMTIKPEPEIEVEGSGQIQNTVLGSSPFNTVMAGSVAETASAAPVPAEPLEPQMVTERQQAKAPEALAPSKSRKSNAVQTSSNAQTVAPVARKPLQPALKLKNSEHASLASEQSDEALEKKMDEVISATPVRSAAKPVVQGQESMKPAKVEPSATTSKAAAVELEEDTRVAAQTAEPVTQEQERLEVASSVPAPPTRPKTRPQHVAEKKEKSEPQKNEKTQSKKRTKGKASRTSRSGAGGKSNNIAQKGGSQRMGDGKTAGNSNVTSYPAKVRRKLFRSVRKPEGGAPARKDAVVKFTVARNGSISGVSLVRTSGSKAVDKAVLKAVHRAAPFPPIPAEARRNNWSFSIQVRVR